MTSSEVTHDGLVAKIVDSQTVVLNIGTRNGVSTDDRFVVFSLGEEVFDPKTGQSLGTLENVKGKGKVAHVQDHLCTIETYEIETTLSSEEVRKSFSGLAAPWGGPWAKRNIYRQFVDVERGDYARKINAVSSFIRRLGK